MHQNPIYMMCYVSNEKLSYTALEPIYMKIISNANSIKSNVDLLSGLYVFNPYVNATRASVNSFLNRDQQGSALTCSYLALVMLICWKNVSFCSVKAWRMYEISACLTSWIRCMMNVRSWKNLKVAHNCECLDEKQKMNEIPMNVTEGAYSKKLLLITLNWCFEICFREIWIWFSA